MQFTLYYKIENTNILIKDKSMSDLNFAQKAVNRFWYNLKNAITELLKTNVISEKTTIKDLLKIIEKKGN